MNIFEKRPLCLILCIGLCGFLLFSFENDISRSVAIILGVLLLFFSLFLRKDKSKQLIAALSAGAILLGSLLSFLYFELYFKAYNIYDGELEIVGTVEAVSESSSYSQKLLVQAESINGDPSSYRFYAYPTKKEATGIIEGTRISFKATLEGFSKESYIFNISDGINAYAGDITDITIIEYTEGNLRVKLGRIREYLTRYTISLSDKQSGAIISALLLGERDYLPDQLRLDFKRIGISHILALSGMHLAILSVGIGKALSLAGVKKKGRVAITAIFVFIYMALTGFSVSVVRAGFMLIISSLLYLLGRTKDSLTSLSVAVLLICIITPYAILDVSLWLSALATFGIIAFSEYSAGGEKPETLKDRIIRYLVLSIMASIFAISATIFVSTICFGGFSILAPITTIIFSFLAEVIMYLGCVMILIGRLIPVGWIIRPICWLMTVLAGAFSSIDLAYVSANFTFVIVSVILYSICFYLFLVLKLKRQNRALSVLLIMYIFVTVSPVAATIARQSTETIAYCYDNKCDEMLIRSQKEVCLINSSQYSKNLAYTSLDFLEDANVTHLNKYYLTHYSWSIDDELEVLLYNISVDEIYIPEPRNDDEETILKLIKKSVEDHRTKVVVFQEYESVYVGDYRINLLYSEPYGNTSMNAFAVTSWDTVYTYVSSGLLTSKSADKLKIYFDFTDHLILGDHGKKYKDKIYLEESYSDLDTLILHSENVFLKQDNMLHLLSRGCKIYSHPKDIIYFSGK